MTKSMTGFGRAEAVKEGYDIAIEIKSVNHRYFEFNSRISRNFSFLDEKIKSYIKSQVTRGKIDAFVSIDVLDSVSTEVEVNNSLLEGYLKSLQTIASDYDIRNDISVGMLSRFPDVLVVRKSQEDEEKIWSLVKEVLDQALTKFTNMREVEGEKLKTDLISRGETILGVVDFIEEESPRIVEEYGNKLKEKIAELLGTTSIDEQRVLTEVAIFADKTAVNEETVRLKSHISQMNQMLNSPDAVGRKLDFLVQEMNREINTIGSKCQSLDITRKVVDVKSEIEKIREQVQNIE